MDLAQAGSTVESKIYDTLQWQVEAGRGPGRKVPVLGNGHHPLLPRSGPFCLASARGPQMWKPPSEDWHGLWAWPSVSAQISGSLCARPCALSSPRAVRQVCGGFEGGWLVLGEGAGMTWVPGPHFLPCGSPVAPPTPPMLLVTVFPVGVRALRWADIWALALASRLRGVPKLMSRAASVRVNICVQTLIVLSEADQAEVSRFAKNFLPILFNLYGQPVAPDDTPAPRRAVLETIRTYLTITESQVGVWGRSDPLRLYGLCHL